MVKRYNPHSEIDVSAWIVEAPGGSVVMASDYDLLCTSRQHEFAYLEKVLKVCAKATAADIRDELRDLRAWAANRSTCFSMETKDVDHD